MDKVKTRGGTRPLRSSYDFSMHSDQALTRLCRVVDVLLVANFFVNFTTRMHVLVHLNVDTLKSM